MFRLSKLDGVVLDEGLLRQARESSARLAEAQHHAESAKADYHHAVRLLHLGGASMREIAEALDISHQRVHQIIDGAGGEAGWKPRKKAAGLACTFCGTARTKVSRLVAGPGVYICGDCIALAQQVVVSGRPLALPGTHLDPVPSTSPLTCSFCGKPANKVDLLVAGPGVRICSGCIQLCTEIITAPVD